MKQALAVLFTALSVSPVKAATLEDAARLSGAPIARQAEILNGMFDHNKRAPGLLPTSGQTGPGSPLSQAELKDLMLQNLDFVSMSFKSQYAPAVWKRTHNGWDLDAEIRKAKAEVRNTPGITLKQYQAILRRVILSTKDYHVSVGFIATERATLPFQVGYAKGKFFFVRIDRSKLPETSFPFHEGDELVMFGGENTDAAVKRIQATMGDNVAGTDLAIAALQLTARSASRMTGKIPNGPITIAVRPQGTEKLFTHQLIWDYQPELIGDGMQPNTFKLAAAIAARRFPMAWLDNMLAPQAGKETGNKFGLGNREGYLPPLGLKLWESDASNTFDAYLYKGKDGKLYGYVRIPSYVPADANQAVADFAGIMNKFEATADKLVIDQLNNPGGSVFYLYALVSMLSDQAVPTPRHRIAITQQDVLEAVQFLSQPPASNDDEAKAMFGPTMGGYPTSYELYRHMRDFSAFIMQQWNSGNRLTEPTYLWAVDSINPSMTARFTKPVLLLTNELDFSGGDFFPTILQDAKRVKVFGARTAGAGGFIRQVEFPNALGIGGFSMTGSIAERPSGNPIENLGVTPDIKYTVTPADLQGGYVPYANAVNAALAKLK